MLLASGSVSRTQEETSVGRKFRLRATFEEITMRTLLLRAASLPGRSPWPLAGRSAGSGRPAEAQGRCYPMRSNRPQGHSPRPRKVGGEPAKNNPRTRPRRSILCRRHVDEDLKRPVTDRDDSPWHAHVFKDLASQTKYQDAERHKPFIEENKDNWEKKCASSIRW